MIDILSNWMLLAMLSPFLFSICSILDKNIVSDYLKDSFNYFIVINITCFFYLLFMPWQNLDLTWYHLIPFVGGLVHFFGIILYLKSIEKEAPSVIVPLLQLNPIIVLLLSLIFLGEPFSLQKGFAFMLVITGAVIISFKFDKKGFVLNKSVFLVFLCASFWALNTFLQKFSYGSVYFWESFSLYGAGHFIPIMLILIFSRKKWIGFSNELCNMKKLHIFLMFFAQFIGFIGTMCFQYASYLGQVSIVSVMNSFQGVFVFFHSILLTRFLPNFFKEKANPFTLFQKGTAIFIMLIGLAFLYL